MIVQQRKMQPLIDQNFSAGAVGRKIQHQMTLFVLTERRKGFSLFLSLDHFRSTYLALENIFQFLKAVNDIIINCIIH